MEGKGRKGTIEDGCPMKKYLFSWGCLFLLLLNPIMAGAWECEVVVTGPNTIKLDQQVTLSASGTPAGGSYSWSRTPGLIPSGSTATITGFQPTFSEYIKVVGYYTSPKGKKCSATKWLWTCLCTLEDITGPSQAKMGEEISLTTQGDPEGGIYSWTINSGTGTLTPNGPSATFVGDRQGTVELKASYVPPEGGEPCAKYHTIEVGDDCSVSLSGDMYQRPVCRPVKFYAQGQPDPGECTWSPSSDFTTNGCNAVYNGTAPGYNTVTATYTRPGGTTCKDSKSILSYELVDNMTPKKECYVSGTSLVIDDFNLTTSPPGFQNNALLSPVLVSTLEKTTKLPISASLFCDQPGSVSTVITVVNENETTGFGIEVEIPNLIKEPLKFLGIAEQFDFKLKNSYEQGTKCCIDDAKDYTKGSTSVDASIDLKGKTIYGVPMPQSWKKYFTLDALNVDLKGESKVSIKGEYKACENLENWSGGGSLGVKLDAGSEVLVKFPYIYVKGEVKGGTDISETLTADGSKITAKGNWGGVNVSGTVVILLQDLTLKPHEVKHLLIKGDSIPAFEFDLPSLR
jgi:hypothetical protein